MFAVHAKTKLKAGVFKFFQFEERFQKLRFRDGLVWTVGIAVGIKLRFLKFLWRSVEDALV